MHQDFVLLNRMPELDGLMEGLGGFCARAGVGEEVFGEVRLALEEAVSNTIRYGYADQKVHPIRIGATVDGAELILDVEDDGKAFNPLVAPLPDVTLPVEEKRPGGLGILLLREMTDRQDYRREGNLNKLRLVKRFRP